MTQAFNSFIYSDNFYLMIPICGRKKILPVEEAVRHTAKPRLGQFPSASSYEDTLFC